MGAQARSRAATTTAATHRDEVLAARARLQRKRSLARVLEAEHNVARVLPREERVLAGALDVAAPAPGVKGGGGGARGVSWARVHARVLQRVCTCAPRAPHKNTHGSRTMLTTGVHHVWYACATLTNARASRPIWLPVARHRLRLKEQLVVMGSAVFDAHGVGAVLVTREIP